MSQSFFLSVIYSYRYFNDIHETSRLSRLAYLLRADFKTCPFRGFLQRIVLEVEDERLILLGLFSARRIKTDILVFIKQVKRKAVWSIYLGFGPKLDVFWSILCLETGPKVESFAVFEGAQAKRGRILGFGCSQHINL